MPYFAKIFLVVAIVHTVASLYNNIGQSSRNMANAFAVKIWHRSHQCRPTTTVMHQIRMTKPFPESDVVHDHDRAQYCVDHFGSCTIAEMESLKNGIYLFVKLQLMIIFLHKLILFLSST